MVSLPVAPPVFQPSELYGSVPRPESFSEANRLIKQLKPDVIFSKGGFVSVPVVIAGKKNHVPVIIHESDMTPGLANSFPFLQLQKYAVTSRKL